MISGRPSHRFPKGRPRPLIAFEVAVVVCWFAWMVYAPSVPSAAAFWTLSIVFMGCWLFAYASVMKHYERTGQAIALPSVRTRTCYRRLPPLVVAVRISFGVLVAAMLVFGQMRDERARTAIVACVLALFALGLLSVFLEEYYVHTGVAERTSVNDEQP